MFSFKDSFETPYKNLDMVTTEDHAHINGVIFKEHKASCVKKPKAERLVEKGGRRNVRLENIPRQRYMQDLFTTLIDAKWKWVMMLFVVCNIAVWLIFGLIWFIIVIAHGKECVEKVTTFTESFLYAVETSMTIGYGGRAVTSKCAEGAFVLIVQCLVTSLVDAGIVGLIFTKIARPGKRQSTVIFSEHALITKRDNKFCLMFRIADIRKRHLSECHVRLYLFRTYKTLEGKIIPNRQDQLRIGCDWVNMRDDSDRLFLLFPCAVTHVIDRKSPFYNTTPEKYSASDWELVVVLEGVVEATGCTMQARTSYTPSEVFWGYDFVDITKNDQWMQAGLLYKIDNFNDRIPAPYVPKCCPRDYYIQINQDPEPNDVVLEQDELWDDENFLDPDVENRVLKTHRDILPS